MVNMCTHSSSSLSLSGGGSSGVSGRWFSSSSTSGERGVLGDFVLDGVEGEPKKGRADRSTGLLITGLLGLIIGDI